MDLIEDAAPQGNLPEFTVSELSGAIRRVIEGEFGLVRVRAEVGRVSRPASGHLYFDLKDERSVLAAIVWKGQAARLAQRPEEGMEVVATGRLTTFPGQSKYQMIVEDIAPAGVGALMAMLEKRKAALAAEGLFDPARKQAIPFLPGVIGVVTSPSGAVIRDILHRLRDRFPRRVLVWPVAVQGAACAPEVARAIAGFNALPAGGPVPRPDVIDLAADRRAPTPSAAAEMAVPVRTELLAAVGDLAARLARAGAAAVALRRQRVSDLGRVLPRPERLTQAAAQRLDQIGVRLDAALAGVAARKRLRLADLALRPALLDRKKAEERRRLAALALRLSPGLAGAGVARARERLAALDRLRLTLGYEATLQRGFAVVRGDGHVVSSVAAAAAAASLELQFADGRLALGSPPAPRPARKPPRPAPPEQGSLI